MRALYRWGSPGLGGGGGYDRREPNNQYQLQRVSELPASLRFYKQLVRCLGEQQFWDWQRWTVGPRRQQRRDLARREFTNTDRKQQNRL